MIELALGTEEGDWPIYVGMLPDEPDEAIAIFDTAGTLDGRLMATGETIEHPGIQVRVRGFNYAPTKAKIDAIAVAISSQSGSQVELDGDTYVLKNISRRGSVNNLGIGDDDKSRYHFTLNAITTIERL